MKIREIELEREDMITLFSDGTFDSPLFVGFVGDDSEIKAFRTEEHEKYPSCCIEDIWVDWLLKGGKLYLDGNECDPEDEDEYDEDLYGEFDLAKFNKGINDALNDDEVKHHVTNLMNGDDDFYTGYCLLQYIAYGEVILG